jgi:hypothetical protein
LNQTLNTTISTPEKFPNITVTMSFLNDEVIAAKSQTPTTAGDVLDSPVTIDPVLHKRVMLKLDAVVLGCFGVIYLLANLDRNNLVRVRLAPRLVGLELRKLARTALMQATTGQHEYHGSPGGPRSQGQRVWECCNMYVAPALFTTAIWGPINIVNIDAKIVYVSPTSNR